MLCQPFGMCAGYAPFLQDRERGVVWEETIIFLQDDAKMVSSVCAQLVACTAVQLALFACSPP